MKSTFVFCFCLYVISISSAICKSEEKILARSVISYCWPFLINDIVTRGYERPSSYVPTSVMEAIVNSYEWSTDFFKDIDEPQEYVYWLKYKKLKNTFFASCFSSPNYIPISFGYDEWTNSLTEKLFQNLAQEIRIYLKHSYISEQNAKNTSTDFLAGLQAGAGGQGGRGGAPGQGGRGCAGGQGGRRGAPGQDGRRGVPGQGGRGGAAGQAGIGGAAAGQGGVGDDQGQDGGGGAPGQDGNGTATESKLHYKKASISAWTIVFYVSVGVVILAVIGIIIWLVLKRQKVKKNPSMYY